MSAAPLILEAPAAAPRKARRAANPAAPKRARPSASAAKKTWTSARKKLAVNPLQMSLPGLGQVL